MFAHNLSAEEISRYSRQLIIPEFGVDSQIKLKAKSALIIGCGGLGCTAALYLAVCGIGKLGLVDHDHIELSNLHRQLAHTTNAIGHNKATNLANECKIRNCLVEYVVHDVVFAQSNGCEVVNMYDVVLDCTDNVITRYLINDCCVAMHKPLVCGSALKFDGQLTIYNHDSGPCMRCIYPKAPPRESVSNCSDAGIFGPVVGTIGNLQAMEAIKILTNIGDCLNGRLLIFNALQFVMKTVRLRGKNPNCDMCTKTTKSIENYDYLQFCDSTSSDDKTQSLKILAPDERIRPGDLKNLLCHSADLCLLVDVRPKHEFKICSLNDSLNVDFELIKANIMETVDLVKQRLMEKQMANKLVFVCRRGNDSQKAAQLLKPHLVVLDINRNIEIFDLIGGLTGWTTHVEPNFPIY
jgi:adenylyltransferase/sulfurtransferase